MYLLRRNGYHGRRVHVVIAVSIIIIVKFSVILNTPSFMLSVSAAYVSCSVSFAVYML